MKHRIGRVETQIQREIDDILLKDVNDPRVQGVTITGINLTGDLQEAPFTSAFFPMTKRKSLKRKQA